MENQKPKSLNSISDDELDAISGGYILDQGEDAGIFRYMLVQDRTGLTCAYCESIEDMEKRIDEYNGRYKDDFLHASKQVITRDQYREIFGKEWTSYMYIGH